MRVGRVDSCGTDAGRVDEVELLKETNADLVEEEDAEDDDDKEDDEEDDDEEDDDEEDDGEEEGERDLEEGLTGMT